MKSYRGPFGLGNLIVVILVLSVFPVGFVCGRSSGVVAVPYTPPDGYAIVDALSKGENTSFDLISAETEFDIRPKSRSKPRDERDRVQLTVMTDTILLKRTGPGRYYSIPYSTCSKAGMELKCESFPYKTEKVKSIDYGNCDEDGFGIIVDLDSVKIGSEVKVIIKGYYWNSFQKELREDAATYTDPDIKNLQSLKLTVRLPDDREFAKYNLVERRYQGKKAIDEAIVSTEAELLEDRRRFAWSIRNPKPERIYRVEFDIKKRATTIKF